MIPSTTTSARVPRRRTSPGAARGARSFSRRARGFSILLLLAALGMLGVFALVATRLVNTTLGVYREAGRADDEARSVDAAVRQLRNDVWSAREVTTQGAQSVTVIGAAAGGGDVTWHVEPDGTLVRTPPQSAGTPPASGGEGGPADAAQRWPQVGARLSFAWDGVSLTVRGADRGADRSGGIRLVSQVKLAAAGGAK